MEAICKKCVIDPHSHSFKKISEKRGIWIFYSRPSQAKLYDDTEGILSHVDNALSHLGNHKWICIIDGEGFDTKHATEVTTGMRLLELFTTKYNTNLLEIRIVNPTWHINGVYKIAKPFLTENMLQKVNIVDDRTYSVFDFL
jgi:hypothetical protein